MPQLEHDLIDAIHRSSELSLARKILGNVRRFDTKKRKNMPRRCPVRFSCGHYGECDLALVAMKQKSGLCRMCLDQFLVRPLPKEALVRLSEVMVWDEHDDHPYALNEDGTIYNPPPKPNYEDLPETKQIKAKKKATQVKRRATLKAKREAKQALRDAASEAIKKAPRASARGAQEISREDGLFAGVGA